VPPFLVLGAFSTRTSSHTATTGTACGSLSCSERDEFPLPSSDRGVWDFVRADGACLLAIDPRAQSPETPTPVRFVGTECGLSAPSAVCRHRARLVGTERGWSAPSAVGRHLVMVDCTGGAVCGGVFEEFGAAGSTSGVLRSHRGLWRPRWTVTSIGCSRPLMSRPTSSCLRAGRTLREASPTRRSSRCVSRRRSWGSCRTVGSWRLPAPAARTGSRCCPRSRGPARAAAVWPARWSG
jgi:hypothetical protein